MITTALMHICCNAEVVHTSLLTALCTITFVEVVSVHNKLKKNTFSNTRTVVPVMNGTPRDQTKVSVHHRWTLVGGTSGRRQRNTHCTTTFITTSDIHTEYNVMHCHNYVCYNSYTTYN